jgi:hypothetical protein
MTDEEFERQARGAAERVRARAHDLAGPGIEPMAPAAPTARSRTHRGTARLVGAVVAAVFVAGGAWLIAGRGDDGEVVVDGEQPSLPPAMHRVDATTPATAPSSPPTVEEQVATVAPTSPPSMVGVPRPFVDPEVCAVTSARTSTMADGELFLFARSREAPVPIQVIGDPAGGPAAPFALVQRYFSSDPDRGQLDAVEIDGTMIGITVLANGNGEAAWDLPDGSHAYVRARGLDRTALEALIGRLTPRTPDVPIPGFDYRPDPATPGLQLVAEHLNTGISGTAARIECTVPATGYSYMLSALDGDAVYEYGGVIDRPVPLHVGLTDTAVIIISGPADPAAPTPADVTTADAEEWHDLLDAPTFNERAATQAPPTSDLPSTAPDSTHLDIDGTSLVGRWTDGLNTFEFTPGGVVRFTLRTSCDGSYAVHDGVITVDFGPCGTDTVNLTAPIFRSAKVYATENSDAIILDGDAGLTRLERLP